MDFKKLTNQAKEQAKGLQDKAKEELDKRGGVDGLKAGAKDVAAAAKTGGSPVDKAKAAANAAKDAVKPGATATPTATGPVGASTGGMPTTGSGTLPTNGNENLPGGATPNN